MGNEQKHFWPSLDADRDFDSRHHGLFQSFLPAPRPDEDDERYDAISQPVYLVVGVLLKMGIPQEEAIHLIRPMWALLHGFLDLEAKGDLECRWRLTSASTLRWS